MTDNRKRLDCSDWVSHKTRRRSPRALEHLHIMYFKNQIYFSELKKVLYGIFLRAPSP